MVRKKDEINKQTKPAPFDGGGEVTMRCLLEGPEEMYQKGRVFNHNTVHPGSAIGIHTHHGESETYYILSGSGIYHDNGKDVEVHPGDVCFCGDGQTHGLRAINEPIDIIALILYK
jgi:mannose-6-phosphate isomerase-like protein (cupin superfamily)